MPAKPTVPRSTSLTAYRLITAEAPPPQLPAIGFIRESKLIPTFVPFSSATLRRKILANEFPRPVKLSRNVTAFRVEDVRTWLELVGSGKPWVAHTPGKER